MKAYIISVNGTPIEIEVTDEQAKRMNRIVRHNRNEKGRHNE